jgi:lanosterol synthase
VFGDIMVDYSYPECTASCLHALAVSRPRLGDGHADLKKRMGAAIKRGERFLRKSQRNDGSWEGSWGVCFTYGTWFGVRGLRAAGASADDPAIKRACAFLLEHQNADGGWGEKGDSCRERRYLPMASHVVNTAWALLTLVDAGQAHDARARRAARFLLETQLANGDWPRQTLVGVFNKTTLINYENYRRYFPIWALGRMAASG